MGSQDGPSRSPRLVSGTVQCGPVMRTATGGVVDLDVDAAGVVAQLAGKVARYAVASAPGDCRGLLNNGAAGSAQDEGKVAR